jgi:hypothetical protein
MSVGGNSYKDLQIGAEHMTVGSNSRSLGVCKPGDRVIIAAHEGKTKYFTVGVIGEERGEVREMAQLMHRK